MPPLSPVVDKLEDIPEAVRSFYEQRDGKYHIALSGAPVGFVPATELQAANTKIVDFRNNNLALIAERDGLKTALTPFEGLDAKEAREAIEARKALSDKGVKDPKDVTALVQAGIEAAMKPVTQQLEGIKSEREQAQRRADDLLLKDVIGGAFTKAGGEAEALEFMVGRARDVFEVKDGVLKAKPGQFSADKPGDPMSVSEWLTAQTKQAAFAFKSSNGGGANPTAKPGSSASTRGNVPVLLDPTPQDLGKHADSIRKGEMVVRYSANG